MLPLKFWCTKRWTSKEVYADCNHHIQEGFVIVHLYMEQVTIIPSLFEEFKVTVLLAATELEHQLLRNLIELKTERQAVLKYGKHQVYYFKDIKELDDFDALITTYPLVNADPRDEDEVDSTD